MTELLRKAGYALGIAAFTGLAFLVSTDTTDVVPAHAYVIADPIDSVYHAPPYIGAQMERPITHDDFLEVGISMPERITVEEARKRGFEPAEASVEGGYFMQETGMTLWWALEQATGWNPWPERWNEDGSWNW